MTYYIYYVILYISQRVRALSEKAGQGEDEAEEVQAPRREESFTVHLGKCTG